VSVVPVKPKAASRVPEETTTMKPPRRSSFCAASTPSVPTAMVARPPKNSQSPLKGAGATSALAEQDGKTQQRIHADLGEDGEHAADRRVAAA
jgi:hypothetical protein